MRPPSHSPPLPRRYEQNVKKQKVKLAARAEERTAKREDREAEIRGKYGLWKDSKQDEKSSLLESGSAGSKY